MAQKRSKKKRPLREDVTLREQLKIEEGVFDERTMKHLGKLFTHNIISELGFITAKGKEADVYLARAGSAVEADVVVVKIFRIETSDFKRRMDYITGDPRFGRIKRTVFHIVNTWCKKEYGNLRFAESAGVHAPKPYYASGNVLSMSLIGDNGVPADTLRDVALNDPAPALDSILADVKKLYDVGLVHGDVSEYNVLMRGDTPYLIDFGQAVVLRHPKAMMFLERDVTNLLAYFGKAYGIRRDAESVLADITGK